MLYHYFSDIQYFILFLFCKLQHVSKSIYINFSNEEYEIWLLTFAVVNGWVAVVRRLALLAAPTLSVATATDTLPRQLVTWPLSAVTLLTAGSWRWRTAKVSRSTSEDKPNIFVRVWVTLAQNCTAYIPASFCRLPEHWMFTWTLNVENEMMVPNLLQCLVTDRHSSTSDSKC